MTEDERAMAGDVPVLFIAGHGRSGSTLVSRVLGRVPGFCAVGELRYLWTQGLRGNYLCGCGERFHDCPFWGKVGAEAFGGWDRVDVGDVLALHRTIVRNRYMPLHIAPSWAARSFQSRLARYAEYMEPLYRGIQSASGSSVIVDSSKFPSSAYLLRRVPGLRLQAVHLVRSSLGVCHSWAKQIERADRGGRLMARHSPPQASLEWLAFNFFIDALRLYGVPTTLLRYEDFVASPLRHVERILAFCEQPRTAEDLSFIGTDSVDLPADHSVAGNPMRVRTGRLKLHLDDEWRTAMPPGTRRLVTLLTAPGLLRYGYHRSGRQDTSDGDQPRETSRTSKRADLRARR